MRGASTPHSIGSPFAALAAPDPMSLDYKLDNDKYPADRRHLRYSHLPTMVWLQVPIRASSTLTELCKAIRLKGQSNAFAIAGVEPFSCQCSVNILGSVVVVHRRSISLEEM